MITREEFEAYKRKNRGLVPIKKKEAKKKKPKKTKRRYPAYEQFPKERILNTKNLDIDVAANEIFVFTQYEHYFVSTHGRIINNICGHYELSELKRNEDGKLCVEIHIESGTSDKLIEELVAETLLISPEDGNKVWHLDKNIDNNYYGNLIVVKPMDYGRLKSGSMSANSILYQHGWYIPTNSLTSKAYSVYGGIVRRCGHETSYIDAEICDEWLCNKYSFVKWYMENWYECDGEQLAVDKDLIYPGNKVYAPDKCILLPQKLNSSLANCKKHYLIGGGSLLPYGVHYDVRMKMYYSTITYFGTDERVLLNYWDTPEEAFTEYREHKMNDILKLANLYKDKIPKAAYKALLRVQVRPF